MSVPSIGGLVGGLVGGIIGGLLGGPFGAAAGFSIGLGIGTFIDPPSIEQADPSPFAHQDLQFNTFAKNLPVPVVYGVNRIGGNIIWIGNTRSEIIEHPVEGGGKGGPPDPPPQQEIRFGADFAATISEGPIAGVAQVWVDDDDISEKEGLNFTTFLGSNQQTPPSQMVTALGSDAPAFRNLAYTLFTGDLGNLNRIPVINQLVSGVFGSLETQGGTVLGPIAGTLRFHAGFCHEDRPEICVAVHHSPTVVYRSTDGGETWAALTDTNCFGITGQFGAYRLTRHEGVAGRSYLLIGGLSGSSAGLFLTSTDYGETYTNTKDCGPLDVGAEIQGIMGLDGSASEIIVWGSPNGALAIVRKSNDGGDTWTGVASFGSAITAEYCCQFPGGNTIFCKKGSAFVGTFRSTDRGENWTEAGNMSGSGGDTCETFGDDVGFGDDFNGVQRSLDRGQTWSQVHGKSGVQRILVHDGILYVSARVTANPEFAYNLNPLGDGPFTTIHQELPGPDRDFFITDRQICHIGGTPANIYCENIFIPTSCGNPAVIIKDFISNPRYGLGISSSTINHPSFAAAHTFCAGQIEVSSGTFEQRFCLDIVLDRGKPSLDHLRDMLSTFRGFLTWSQGEIKLRIEKEESVSQSFDMSNISDESFNWRKQSYRDRPNVVKVEFIEPGADNAYRLDFAQAYDNWDIDLSGERRERIFRLIGIKRRTQAQRMAQFYLDQAIHVVHAASFRVGIAALQSEVGDVVEVTHDVPAWTNKKFRILEISEAENDELQLTLLEYSADVYQATDQTVPDTGDDRAPIRDFFAVPYHTARLTAHQRPITNEIEISMTRVATNDLLTSQQFFISRNGGEFEIIGQGIPTAPTAFLESHIRSVAITQSGEPSAGLGLQSGFQDDFARADVDSLGDPWVTAGAIPEMWQIISSTAARGDTASIGAVQSQTVAHAASKTIGHFGGVAIATMFDGSGTSIAPGVSLLNRWQPAGDIGQYYSMEYATRTESMEITRIDIFKTLSGQVNTLLATTVVSQYFTTPASPTEFRFRIQRDLMTSWLNSVEILTVSDTDLTGDGESGLAYRSRGYSDLVLTDNVFGYWRLDESSGAAIAVDQKGLNPGSYSTTGITWEVSSVIADFNAGIHIGSTGGSDLKGHMEVPKDTAAVGICQQNEFTVELWAASSDWLKYDTFATFHNCGAKEPWQFGINGAGLGLFWSLRNGFAEQQVLTGAGVLTASNTKMHHLVAIRTQSHMSIYVNATLEASVVVNCSEIRSFDAWFSLGQRFNLSAHGGDDDAAHCFMDEVAFYQHELSSETIFAHYTCGVGSGCPGFGDEQGERWLDFEYLPFASDTLSGFTDDFNRADATSAGDPWLALGQDQELWRIDGNALQRGDTASADGSVSSMAVLRTDAKTLTQQQEIIAQMFDSSGTAVQPFVSLIGRWQEAGSVGQYYAMEYTSRTDSHEISQIDLRLVTSGQVSTLLSFVTLAGSNYFTIPASPTEFKLRMEGTKLEGFLNDVSVIKADDSTITGPGESGFAYRFPFPDEEAYLDMVKNDSAYALWQLDETDITSVVFDAIGGHHGSFQSDVVGQGHTVQQTGTFIDGSGVRGKGIHFGSGTVNVDEGWVQLHKPVHNSSFRANEFTVECWYASSFHNHHGSFPCLMCFGINDEWTLFLDTDFKVNWNTEFPFLEIEGVTSLEQDFTLYHIVALRTVESRHMAVFVNATLEASATMASSDSISSKNNAMSFGSGLNTADANTLEVFGVMDQVAYYPFALNSAQIFQHYKCGIGSGCGEGIKTQGEKWENFEGLPIVVGTSTILVQFVPDGWGAQILNPNSTVVATGTAAAAQVIIDMKDVLTPASGFLLLTTDGTSFSQIAGGGLFPSSGNHTFRPGDVFDYNVGFDFVTATQTFIPIFSPKGGFANVGSARLRNEQMGYDTFTDLRIEGVTRGAGDTVATSHSNLTSLEASVLLSGGGLLDLSAALADVASNVSIFTEQSQYLYLGTNSRFSLVDVMLVANAPTPISLGYEYSTGDGVWANLQASGFIPVFDGTSGFSTSGKMFFEPPGNWETTRGTLPGSNDLTDGTSRFYLRMINTTTAATPPKEMSLFLDGEVIFAVRKTNAFIYNPTLVDSGAELTFKALAVGGRGPQVQDGTVSPVFTIQESSS